jgi:predicted ATPase
MIKRLYVDNYKCLVNFTYEPGALQLLFGENGTGKSTVFEVLTGLRQLVLWGSPTEQVFPTATLTAWQSRPEQTFELDVEGNGGNYTYRVTIEHNRLQRKSRVKEEELRFNGNPLYRFDGENAHLFRDDFSAGPVFPVEPSRSGVASIPERADSQRLTWFRGRLGLVYAFAVDPLRMNSVSVAERKVPDPPLADLASWYRHLTQDSPETTGPLFESLGHVIAGFVRLKLTSVGEMARLLQVWFKHTDEQSTAALEFPLGLDQLSPGQRCLIALFMVLHGAVAPDITLCIDEPDNFVALRELQPWLTELCDRVEEKHGQCLLISHHPEFIDLLAVKHGVRFTRDGVGPVRIKPFEWSKDDGLSASEIVARGWEE